MRSSISEHPTLEENRRPCYNNSRIVMQHPKGKDAGFMEYKVFGDTIFMRVDRGEEILECLARLCEEEDVKLGKIAGLGAVDYVEAGYYSVGEKQYHKHVFAGEAEIVSLTGSATRMDGKVYLHLHIALSREDGSVVGGHLNKGRISATGEIIVTRVNGEVGRRYNDAVGLNLFDF